MIDRKTETRRVGPSSGRVIVPDRLPAGRAVDRGRLLELARDALEPGQQQDHVEAEVLPRDDHEQREHHDRAVGQPELDEAAEARRLERLVDERVRHEQELPDDRRDDLGEDVRREEDQPEERPPAEPPVEHQGQPERERDLDDQRQHHEDTRCGRSPEWNTGSASARS